MEGATARTVAPGGKGSNRHTPSSLYGKAQKLATVKCPHCGREFEPNKQKRPYESKTIRFANSQRFGNVATMAQPPAVPGSTVETPVYMPSLASHVVVPGLQAVIYGSLSALIGGTMSGLIADGFGYKFWPATLAGVGLTFPVVALAAWNSKVRYYDGLLVKFEEWSGWDINRDGVVGKPEPRQIQVEVRDDRGNWQRTNLPGFDEEGLYWFSVNVTRGQATFSERDARQAGLSVEDFRRLRDEFFKNRWCVWKNEKAHQQGVELTIRGAHVLAKIAGEPPEGLARDNGDDFGMSPNYVDRASGKDSWS